MAGLLYGDEDAKKTEKFKSYAQLMKWCAQATRMQVRTNADTPEQTQNAISFGAVGFWDDYLKVTKRNTKGVPGKVKLAVSLVVAAAAAYYISENSPPALRYTLAVPFFKDVLIPLGLVGFVAFGTLVIVGASNAVNLTDGLDGLAGGTLVLAYVCFMIIALLNSPQQPNLAYLCALIIGGLLCGLSGAYLSIAHNAAFIRDMSAGKGYLALAALIFGKWRPVPTLIACLLFAFADAVQIRLQGVPVPLIGVIPVQLIQALPYILTVFLLAGFVGKSIAPKASGIPYLKER